MDIIKILKSRFEENMHRHTKINWSGIKDVSKTDTKNQIVVISNTMYNGLNTCIFFKIDNPELIEKYQLQHSPLLIVDEKVTSMGMPDTDTINELKKNKDKQQNKQKKHQSIKENSTHQKKPQSIIKKEKY